MSLTVAASAMLMTWNMLAGSPDARWSYDVRVNADTALIASEGFSAYLPEYTTVVPTVADTLPTNGPILAPEGLSINHDPGTSASDTLQQQRQKAISYSDGYYTRLTWHRRLSWAMLPLFAASYVTGDQILKRGSDAPKWARDFHGPAASGSAILFGANTFTGAWNLWEGRAEPTGRVRRITHAALFTAASAGFVYAGTQLASEAQQSQSKRLQHRNVAIASMGVSTASWLLMLIGN